MADAGASYSKHRLSTGVLICGNSGRAAGSLREKDGSIRSNLHIHHNGHEESVTANMLLATELDHARRDALFQRVLSFKFGLIESTGTSTATM